ncbi:WD40 repeat domain-containing serine/threonine protein kinase [Nonomuraea indica]|uniref:WD40 repeat domain-containing serine/threonine protein kinase n=1 Tax=Nonomuraea indica TaxID=1581193 RepID=A0ABW8A2J2_9ACTN
MATGLIDGDPQRLGDYWLAARLGAGGQGVVYEAYAEDGRRVAIKVLHGDQTAQLGREAEAAQRVASFCTAQVIAAELDGPRPYIVSEYVEGPSLRKAVADGRRFAGGDLIRLATAVATALTAIHEAGVVHRDLKPDNVLLGPDGPRVIDFGIARTEEMSLTDTGLVKGTPSYMAPEVFTGQRAGASADVFAWGAIMLFAATGADPFQADSLGGVMHRVLSSTPDLGALPAQLRPLVAAALSKEPAQRPDARGLLLALVSGEAGIGTAGLLARGGQEAARVVVTAEDPALGALAEDAYALLDAAERELAPEVFLRLVTVDERGELSLRHAATAELVEGRPLPEVAAITRILKVFGYLLAREGEEVRLARPALPHAWPRYRRWIDTNRDGLAVHRQILVASRQWDAGGRRDGDLFHGSSLENALQWAATARRNITLSPAERDFLEAAAGVSRRRARRSRLVSLSLAGLLVISLVAGGLAVQQSMVADERAALISRQLRRSEATRLTALADAARGTDPRLAMRLSAAAWSLDHTPQTRAGLVASLAQRETAAFKDPAVDGGTVRWLSADGRTLLSVGENAARLWDLRTGRRVGGIRNLGLGAETVADAALSPSGRVLVAVTDRGMRAWDPADGRLNMKWDFDRVLDLRNTAPTLSFTDERGPVLSVGDRPTVRWNLATGTRSRAAFPFRLDAKGEWDMTSRETVLRLTNRRTKRKVPLGEQDGANERGGWNKGSVAVSADGRFAASASATEIQIWRLADRGLLTTVPVRGDSSESHLPVGFFDGRVYRYLVDDRVFSVDLSDLAARDDTSTSAVAFAPGGRHLVITDMEGTKLRQARGGDDLGALPTTDSVAFTADGRRLAILRPDRIRVADVPSRATLAELRPATGGMEPLLAAFSPDGARLAIVLRTPDDGTSVSRYAAQVWDWRGRRRLWSAKQGEITDAAFSPDGRTLVLSGPRLSLLDAATGRRVGAPFGGEGVRVFFTHTGEELVVLDSRGRVTLWDAATRRILGAAVRGADGMSAAYSPTEDIVAVGGKGRVLLFDPFSETGLGAYPDAGGAGPDGGGWIRSLAFTADGSSLLTVDDKAVVREQPVAPAKVLAAVCARAGGPLTPAQWETHVPALPYRRACP